MKRMKRLLALMAAVLLAASVAGCGGSAADFPSKNIEVIVPYSAGGGTDQVARALADIAKEKLGQPVVVVNKTGGGGAVGMGEGAKAKADGYTVTMVTVELVTLPHLGLAPISHKDFEPVLRVNVDPAAITVRADAPWRTLEEFLADAKQRPGQIKVGNSGTGAIWHLAASALEQEADVTFNHIPFNGAAPAVTALLGGNIDAVGVSPGEVLTHVQAGKLRVLGVMSDERVKTLPDVPTMKEQGVDLALGTWRGLAVPKGTPAAVVQKLHDGFKQAMEEPAFVEFMDKAGLGIGYQDGKNFAQLLEQESNTFGKVITDLGLSKK